MAAVRQHYKLATTGKLGQNTSSGKAVSKSTRESTHRPSKMKKGSGYGSHKMKSGY